MNSFGNLFKVQLFGESHGAAIGVVIDGVPSGVAIDRADFAHDLARRAGGKKGGTPRVEEDSIHFLSGVFNGYSTGTPIAIIVNNLNTRSEDYENLKDTPRPGHADFVSLKKFNGYADPRGGGHHSGRVTLALVIAGVIAKKITSTIEYSAEIVSIGGESSWESKLEEALSKGDSLGGIIECTIENIPAGLGNPFFDSVESLLSHIIFAIPGIRGVEFGDGFAASSMWGSEHNDPIVDSSGKTARNASGGINGGISNGNPVKFRVAVKPTSSISIPQNSYNFKSGKVEPLLVEGRHDTSFALRVPVILEAVSAIVFANLTLEQGR